MARALIFAVFLMLTHVAYSADKPLSDVTILVSSHDKSAPLWPSFFKLLFKEWSSLNTYNKSIPIVLMSNTKTYKNPRVHISYSPHHKGWAGNISDALRNIKTKYVLYLQDDYFMSDQVLENKLVHILNIMKKSNLDYAEISPRCAVGTEHVSRETFLIYKDHSTGCFTTLQAAFWKTSTFLEFTESHKSSIWKFETRKLKPYHKFAFYSAKTKPLKYENFMYKGHLDFRPYIWMYYNGYDLSFANQYKIHPKYKLFGTEIEWFRENTPKISKIAFYTSGFFFTVAQKVKKQVRLLKDYYTEKSTHLKATWTSA